VVVPTFLKKAHSPIEVTIISVSAPFRGRLNLLSGNQMNSFRYLFLVFLIVPFVEIYFLIEVGSAIGAVWTIFLVVLTAIIGALLVRVQGFAALTRVQTSMANGQLPALELVEGLFLLVAGAVLLTPGFFTDAIGFALLTPPIRRTIATLLVKHSLSSGVGVHGAGPQRPTSHKGTIEGEYRRVDD